jgi:hypothetical protein
MKDRLLFHRVVFFIVFLVISCGVASCRSEMDTRLDIWLDFPRDGATVQVGEPVEIISHAYASEGISEVVLYVNSVAYSRVTPGENGADLSEFRHEWLPSTAGDFTLQLWVYDSLGEAGGPATAYIHVADIDVIEFVFTRTPTPVLTTVAPITATPVITFTPTATQATYTPTPHPPTYTPTSSPTAYVDNTAPPIPTPVVPADGLTLSCRSTQVLNWLPVQDPSGIRGYYVRLEYESTPGNWVTENNWGPISEKQLEVPVNCGGIYRWRVRVEDGAGNMSGWSNYFYFNIDLT